MQLSKKTPALKSTIRKTLYQALTRHNMPWTLGILSFPFYLFPKGGLQISSILLILAALQSMRWQPGAVINPGDKSIQRLALPLFLLVIWVILVTLAWTTIIGTTEMLIFPMYYIFNLFIFIGVAVRCVRAPGFASLIVNVTLASVLLQVFLSSVGMGSTEGSRTIIYFQNPNQLGYYSLLSASILAVGVRKGYIKPVAFIMGLLSCLWLAQLSLSKAAMASITILLAYGGLRGLKSFAWGVIAVVIVLGLGRIDQRVDLIGDRFESVGEQSDDSLAGRGYDRIWNHPEINILGGGEGAGWRWDSFIGGSEIHSSWGTILFSYGIPGLTAALFFLYRLSGRLGLASFVPILAVFAYGVTHMGLRFVPMWILFGLIAGISARESLVRRQTLAQKQTPGIRRAAKPLFR